jgi:hypothetical protein
MDPKEVAIRCPCCDSRLLVDVRTAKVLSWSKPGGEVDAEGKPKLKPEDWDAAEARAKGRLAQGLDKFEAGLKKEEQRTQDLEQLWKKLGKREDDKAS